MTSLPVPDTLHDRITEASRELAIVFRPHPRFANPCSVPTWMYSIRTLDVERLDSKAYIRLSDWFFQRGWLMTRQKFPEGSDRIWDFISEKHIVTTNARRLFHATEKQKLPQIVAIGLLPGSQERCNWNRLDTIRNIYFAQHLGYPGDPNAQLNGTAYWWREHLAGKQSRDPEEWAIVSVATSDMMACELVRDPWSSTGIICRTEKPVPAKEVPIVA